MAGEKSIVITAYGHEKTIDKMAISLFDKSNTGYYSSNCDSNAQKYCDTINSLELKGDSWVFARIIPDNTPITLDIFLPVSLNLLLKLEDRAIQKVLREVDTQVLARALKIENEAIQERIFKNMSKEAARMLKDDMEIMGPIRIKDAKEAQEKIVNVIRQLDQTGHIIIPYS